MLLYFLFESANLFKVFLNTKISEVNSDFVLKLKLCKKSNSLPLGLGSTNLIFCFLIKVCLKTEYAFPLPKDFIVTL